MASGPEKSGQPTASAEAKQERWEPKLVCRESKPGFGPTTAEAPKLGRVG